MVYKYPDKTGKMVETPYFNDFMKGVEEAMRHGYGPGHDTRYHPPKKAERMTFAQASERLKKDLGIDFRSPAERAQAEFAAQVGQEVARQLQMANAIPRQQAPVVTGESTAPANRQISDPSATRRGMSFAEASQKLKRELGRDVFADEGEGAPAAIIRNQEAAKQPVVMRRRFGPTMSCQLRQL